MTNNYFTRMFLKTLHIITKKSNSNTLLFQSSLFFISFRTKGFHIKKNASMNKRVIFVDSNYFY